MPNRELYWNISMHFILYMIMIPICIVLVFGIFQEYRLWKKGKPLEQKMGSWARRFGLLLKFGVGQRRVVNNAYPGLMHLMIFWGFIILFFGTLLVGVQKYLGVIVLEGRFYLWYSLILDLAALLLLVGIIAAGIRRCILKPSYLTTGKKDRFRWSLLVLFLVGISGLLVEGLRIAATNDPWVAWQPIGMVFAWFFTGLSNQALSTLHSVMWWLHLVFAFSLLAVLPYSNLLHVITAPLNIFLSTLEPKGKLATIDIEGSDVLGVKQLEHYSWKDLLDLSACTECGRCQANCPVHLAGKEWSPKKMVLLLRDEMRQGKSPDNSSNSDSLDCVAQRLGLKEVLWECTTCGACREQCPVLVDHISKVVGLRRYLVMEEADYPDLLQDAVKSYEMRGHPFRGSSVTRMHWSEGLKVPHLIPSTEVAAE